MPRINDRMEKIQQPLWATLAFGAPGSLTPLSSIAPGQYTLFEGKASSNVAESNLSHGGMLPGTQEFNILAMRVFMLFNGIVDSATTPTANYDAQLYNLAVSQFFWRLYIDAKEYFTAPTWYLPAGGGLWGAFSGNDALGTHVISNGTPDADATLVLGEPIPVNRQQTFKVDALIFSHGGTTVQNVLSNADGTAGIVDIKFVVDGLRLRDVM